MRSLCFVVLLSVISCVVSDFGRYHLSDTFIEEINKKQSTWKAGKNFDESEWQRVKKIANGVLPKRNKDTLKVVFHKDEDVPDSFDARQQWPNCQSLKQIRDQSNCGSCWAFAAVASMSDRICIHSNQELQTLVSAEDLLQCCTVTCGDGCEGGWETASWAYWYTDGISSGGLYNETDQGCKAYSMIPCEHHTEGDRPQCNDFNGGDAFPTPECVKECDAGVETTYEEALTFGQEPYAISSLEKQIQLEIFKNGPVEVTFDVYADFPNYKSGVYQRTNMEFMGVHAVKILGWGEEDATPYWLIANSWNTDWGDNGYFKMIRGVNECGIESNVNAGLPKLS